MTIKEWFVEYSERLPRDAFMFKGLHLYNLIAVVLLAIVAVIVFLFISKKAQNIILYCVASIYLFSYVLISISRIIRGTFSVDTILPFDFCGIVIWATMIAVFFRQKWLNEFIAVGGLFASVVFIAFPEVGFGAATLHFDDLYSIVIHDLMFITSIIYFFPRFSDLRWQTLYRQAICFGFCCLEATILDYWIYPDSNYMFLKNSPININLGRFPYIIVLAIVMISYVVGVYFVAWLIRVINKKLKNKTINTQDISLITQRASSSEEINNSNIEVNIPKEKS